MSLRNTWDQWPDENGRFGEFGGRYVAETLMPLILDLEQEYRAAKQDPAFNAQMDDLWAHYVGRPSPLYFAERLTEHFGGAKIYLADHFGIRLQGRLILPIFFGSLGFYCGTGGCMLNLIVNGETMAWQATGWRLIDWGPDRILLVGRDGGWCGGASAEVCYEALVWSNDKILTVGPEPE